MSEPRRSGALSLDAGGTPRPPNRIHVDWTGAHRFDTGRPGGPVARIDASAETGQSPVDALLTALATCTSVDVLDILAKRRTPAERYAVDSSGERYDGIPRRLVHVHMEYTIDGPGIDRIQAERAIQLAITKYCSVRDSLRADIGISYSLVLNGEQGKRLDS